jgi:phage terminase small subunit
MGLTTKKMLTPKQQRFVDEYLIDLNATQAAIRAGYSEKTAKSIGQENLTKPDLAKAVQERIKERESRVEITQDKVLKDIELIKQDAMRKKLNNAGDEEMLNHNAALKACELQGKHLSMWTDKIDATVTTKELPASVDEFV